MFLPKHRLFANLLVAFSAFLNSCSKGDNNNSPSPVANFNYTAVGENTHAPATVKFSNSSVSASDYAWNFGDGSAAETTREPSHKYGRAGTFIVSLKASSLTKTDTKTQSITISPAYTAVKLANILLTSTTQTSPFTGYLKITDAAGNVYFKSVNLSIDPFTFPKNWALNPAPLLPNINATYNVELWKAGGIFPDTRLAASTFSPVVYTTGDNTANSYPSSIPAINGFSFVVQWQ